MNFSLPFYLCVLFLTMNASVLDISLEKPLGEEAEAYHNRVVNVRGFLYNRASGELILAHQPNLKSCCIGSQALVQQQIFVDGSINAEARAVTLQGTFKIDPHYNEQGQIVRLYRLESAEKLKKEHSLLISSIVFCIIVVAVLLQYRRRRV